MAARHAISEILKAASEKNVNECVEYLKKNESAPLKTFLLMIHNPNVVFHPDLVPEEPTPYTPSEFDEPGMLYSEMRRMYLFLAEEPEDATLKQTWRNLTTQKRQRLWIELLEYVSPGDAAMLDAIKQRKVLWKKINLSIIKRAYPGLLGESTDE